MLTRMVVTMALGLGAACASGAPNGQTAPTQPSPTSSAAQKTMSGQVTYLQRIALPTGAVIEVSLDDVSLADAPARRLGSTTITTKGENVPVPFKLTYDAAAVRPERTYAVSARISIDGQLQWISATRHAVLTSGNPSDDVTITVQQVPEIHQVAATDSQPDESSPVGRWQLERIEYGKDKTVTPSSPEKYRVEFLEGGSLVARLDCNRGRGGYKVSGSTLSIDPILSTLMACGGDSIAREFAKALQTATSFRRRNDTLMLSMPKTEGTMYLTTVP